MANIKNILFQLKIKCIINLYLMFKTMHCEINNSLDILMHNREQALLRSFKRLLGIIY
jgi:hypothetical protein